MGWSIGHDGRWGKFGRDIGYGVPSVCDHPDCANEIHRGISYVCGGAPYGGDHGCGLFFCGHHLSVEDRDGELPQLCERCAAEALPFDPKPDVQEWIDWKLTDDSWAQWRAQNPDEVAAMKASQTRNASDGEATLGEAKGATEPNTSIPPPGREGT